MFREARPVARGVWFGLETVGVLLVLLCRNAFVFHHPLVTSERAVQTPVNEHAELRFAPPLHAARAIFDGGGRGRSRVGRADVLRLNCKSACGCTHQGQVVSPVHHVVSIKILSASSAAKDTFPNWRVLFSIHSLLRR